MHKFRDRFRKIYKGLITVAGLKVFYKKAFLARIAITTPPITLVKPWQRILYCIKTILSNNRLFLNSSNGERTHNPVWEANNEAIGGNTIKDGIKKKNSIT